MNGTVKGRRRFRPGVLGEGAGCAVIGPNRFETGFVECGEGFTEVVVVFVEWEGGAILEGAGGEVERWRVS